MVPFLVVFALSPRWRCWVCCRGIVGPVGWRWGLGCPLRSPRSLRCRAVARGGGWVCRSASGVLVHIAGDAATLSRVPMAWPIRIGGPLVPAGVAALAAVRTGGRVERYLVTGLLFAGALGAGWVLAR